MIEDLLIDFDEMGFAPTPICGINPEEYARKWKSELVSEIERLKAENETYCKQITQAYDTGYDDGYDSCQDDIKQAKIDVLNELKKKTYVNDYCREVVEIEKIDQMIKELIK